MTTTVSIPTVRARAGAVTGRLITQLQNDHLADRPHAVAALARLRRGAGKEFAQVPDLWGLLDTGPLHEPPADGGRPLNEKELSRAEDAVHVAATLWALHQQSRPRGMHQPDRREKPRGLGAAVRRLMPPGDIAEPVLKRFVRAGNAPDLATLAQRLRDIVVLLRGDDIELDYGLLAEQLCHWQEPGGRDAARRAWGRSFQAYRTPAEAAAGSRTPSPTETIDTSKDAS
ncbi:type I-E CRISPR-associated protein Cse2/CasB [Streptomyces sp. NPDC002688]|uniref:type I-E CRISPR-associated protein Cse2/CasB n=1 Tax=Streptomyces sp. NPDC002688 TaxID=3154423 RepID=UPI00331E6C3C